MALLNYYEILTKTLQNCFQNVNSNTHPHPTPNERQQFGREGKFIADDAIIINRKMVGKKKNLYFCQNKTQKIPNDEKIIILLRIGTRALHRLQEPALAGGVCYRLRTLRLCKDSPLR